MPPFIWKWLFLTDVNPKFIRSVEDGEYRTYVSQYQTGADYISICEGWTPDELKAVISNCPKLSNIDGFFEIWSQELLDVLMQSDLSNVMTLDVGQISENFEKFCDLLKKLKSLTKMHLNVADKPGAEVVFRTLTKIPTLKTIDDSRFDVTTYGVDPYPTVESLKLTFGQTVSDIDFAQQFPSLKELKITFRNWPNCNDQVHLRHLKQVTEIIITQRSTGEIFPIFRHLDRAKKVIFKAETVLPFSGQLPSQLPKIEELLFNCDEIPFRSFKYLFSAFPNMKKLRLRCKRVQNFEEEVGLDEL